MTIMSYCENSDCEYNKNHYCECTDIELDFTGECITQEDRKEDHEQT